MSGRYVDSFPPQKYDFWRMLFLVDLQVIQYTCSHFNFVYLNELKIRRLFEWRFG